MVTDKNRAFINIILILIVNKIMLLTLVYNIEKIYIYNKIICNTKEYYNNKKPSTILKEFINKSNQELMGQLNYTFIPDELSIDCFHGINVYHLFVTNTLHAYFAKRINVSVEQTLLTKKQDLINMILTSYPTATNITVTHDNIFFTNHNVLYKYIINQHKIFIYHLSSKIIDYLVGPYYIYVRTQATDNSYNNINVININQQHICFMTFLAIIPKANSFFLRANYLIFLYYNSEPQLYKLINNNKLNIKKLNISFEQLTTTLASNNSNIEYNLYWDTKKQTHVAVTPLSTYLFKLPLDNGILSITDNNIN